MTDLLGRELNALVTPSLCDGDEEYLGFKARIERGGLTRAENEPSHFTAYFLPYDRRAKKVFLIHHRKASLWLSSGGHLEPDESLFGTLNREAKEELGVGPPFSGGERPFMLSITNIVNPAQRCRTHFDVWYLMPTEVQDFRLDAREFHEGRWLSFGDARLIVTDPANLRALDQLE